MSVEGLPLTKAFRSEFFPLDRFDPGGDLTEVLSKILVTDYQQIAPSAGPGGGLRLGLTLAEELVLDVIGLNGFAIVLGGAAATTLSVGADWTPDTVQTHIAAGARLRFPRSLLKPVVQQGDAWVDDPTRPYAEVTISAGVVIDQAWNVTFDGANAFTLPPVMVGDSGVVLEGQVALDFSETTALPQSTAMGLPATWRGVLFHTLNVHLPPSLRDTVPVASLALSEFHIGSGGVSGKIALNAAPGAGMLAGFPFQPTRFSVELRQNALVGMDLAGALTLPFFDRPIDVEVGFDLEGDLTVSLGAAGIVDLPIPNVLDFELDHLTFQRQGALSAVTLGGRLTPVAGGLDWPTFAVKALTLDSEGGVAIEGGWLELPDQYALTFYGFQLAISAIGFGSDNGGGRWIGFNGGLTLVDGLTAGASVEGLRINWSPGGQPSLSLEGVGVEFDVPDVLSFKGFVSMREPAPGVYRFDGDITLQLETPELSIDGQLVIGYNEPAGYTFFAIYVGVELPIGIPLWNTGLGLYGMAGLFALNLEPGRRPDEAWYEIPPGPSWYHRNPPGVGVAELRKWDDRQGSLGLGVGITLGTVVDNGFTFAGRMLLAIVFPGPILLVEGRANVLKPRSGLDDEPMFRTLLVIDGREGTLSAGLDARYQISQTGGELIEIHGSLEAFFDFYDFNAWHLYLGIDEPRVRRIGADIFFKIFHADSYFMIDARRARMGAWTGVEKHWRFGPASVDLEAWIDGRAELSFKPVYFQGKLRLHGGFGVSLFGFGFHLGAEAGLAGGVFDPFYLKADFHISIGLPWPLDDFSVDFSLEWGPDPTPPLLPAPVKEVALGHDLISATWPLAAGSLLIPQIDAGSPQREFFDDQPPALADPDRPPPPVAQLPVVPLDARPEITFGRSVHDDAFAAANGQPQYVETAGWTPIGDPSKNIGPVAIRPALADVQLDRWDGGAWRLVARAAGVAMPGQPRLYGSWMAAPAEPGAGMAPGQTKLRLWSKSPFSFTRRTGTAWVDQFLSQYPSYPCVPLPPPRRVCCDFRALKVGERPAAPWTCPDNDLFVVTWAGFPGPVVERHGRENALCFPPGMEVLILPQAPIRRLTVRAELGRGDAADDCVDFRERAAGRIANPYTERGRRLTAFASDGSTLPNGQIRAATPSDGSRPGGLDTGVRLHCELARPTRVATITVSGPNSIKVTALDTAGAVVATDTAPGDGELHTLTLTSTARGMSRLVVLPGEARPALVHELCVESGESEAVVLEAQDLDGRVIDRDVARLGEASVDGQNADRFVVRTLRGAGVCLLEVCALTGLSPEDELRYGQIGQHTIDELARWQADDDLLPAYSTLRLKFTTKLGVKRLSGSKVDAGFAGERAITQVAYFRTEGPPGLAALEAAGAARVPGAGDGAADDPPKLETGLEDLSRYVLQTIPPTVVPEGVPPRLPRPVYRGYDVGVTFTTNYVDAMYAGVGRDLTLGLFDMNGRPIRDAQGCLLTAPNRWGRMDTLSLTQTDQTWLQVVGGASCTGASIDLGKVARNKTAAMQGFVLEPETTYEARLTPLLAGEGFDGHTLGATASGTGAALAGGLWTWRVRDEGTIGGPSLWRIGEAGAPPDRYVEQTASVSQGPGTRDAPFPGGTLLWLADVARLDPGDPDQPSRWTDYRLSGFVRSTDEDIVGFGVRMSGRSGYLVKVDRRRNRRQLVLVRAADAVVLAEAPGGFDLDTDVQVSVEAVGQRLRVHIDGELLADVVDAERSQGTICLYAADNGGVRFTDTRVEDLRAAAPVVYRFKFTSSAFADFRHHLASGDGRRRSADIAPAVLNAAATRAVDLAAAAARTAPSEAEARAFESVAVAVLGAEAHQRAARASALRLMQGGATQALLVRAAEPLDWTRTRLQAAAASATPDGDPAMSAKLLSAEFATGAAPDPAQEAVRVLLLEDRDLSGHIIEAAGLPSHEAPDLADGAPLWSADFLEDQIVGGVAETVWAPPLDDLSELALVTPPGAGAPYWSAAAGILRQTDAFTSADDTPSGSPVEQPSSGTLAIGLGLPEADLKIQTRVQLKPSGAAGIVFRYVDAQNYYRFMLDRRRGRRILSRVVGGVFKVLHSSGLPAGGGSYPIAIEALGSHLSVSVHDVQVCAVVDAGLAAGAVGFYAQGDPQAAFDQVLVERIPRELGDLRIEDTSAAGDRGVWRVAHGSLIKDPVPGGAGQTFAVAAGAWTDMRLAGLVTPPAGPGEAGLVWRYASTHDHLRLAIRTNGAARLIARRTRVDTVLWSGMLPSGSGPADTVVEAVGRRVRLSIAGALVAEVEDAGLTAGAAGVFSGMAEAFSCSPLAVSHATPAFERWHLFVVEPTRVRGRRLRVAAGSPPPGDVATAGEDARWQNRSPIGYKARLPRDGVDLRLLSPGGEVLHRQRFRPAAAYAACALKVLRAADGTGFVLIPSGGGFPLGELRLDFTYLRDNTATDPHALVLRQEGESAAETLSVFVA